MSSSPTSGGAAWRRRNVEWAMWVASFAATIATAQTPGDPWNLELDVGGGRVLACRAVQVDARSTHSAIDAGIRSILVANDADPTETARYEVAESRRACVVQHPKHGRYVLATVGLEGVYSSSDSGTYLVIIREPATLISARLLQGRYGDFALLAVPVAMQWRSSSCVDVWFDGWRLRSHPPMPTVTVARAGDRPVRYGLTQCGDCGEGVEPTCTERTTPRRR